MFQSSPVKCNGNWHPLILFTHITSADRNSSIHRYNMPPFFIYTLYIYAVRTRICDHQVHCEVCAWFFFNVLRLWTYGPSFRLQWSSEISLHAHSRSPSISLAFSCFNLVYAFRCCSLLRRFIFINMLSCILCQFYSHLPIGFGKYMQCCCCCLLLHTQFNQLHFPNEF